MQLPEPFLAFPFQFDVERMQAEIAAVPEAAWMRHPGDYPGNSALPLISTGGESNNHFAPPMRPTPYLEVMPYLRQVMAQFRTVVGRARLMRLEPGSDVLPHSDLEYYWRSHTRVHVPVVTHPGVRFYCGDASIHMGPGRAYTFDNWRAHRVENRTPIRRVHLVFDTFGSSAFWQLARPLNDITQLFRVPFAPGTQPPLALETHGAGAIMPPSEAEQEVARIVEDVASHPGNAPQLVQRVSETLVALVHDWRSTWAAYGPGDEAIPHFRALLDDVAKRMSDLPVEIRLASNGIRLAPVLRPLLAAMAPAEPATHVAAPSVASRRVVFERPVFVVSAPRSGSTLLFETLAANGSLWTVGGESHGLIEGVAPLHARNRGFESNRLTADDLTPAIGAQLHSNFVEKLVPSSGRAGDVPSRVRFLEKTPKNALRIPFFKALYPDAKFIFLHREAKANISAIMEAWRSGKFVTYPGLPGWLGLRWSMLLIPGWKALVGAPLEAIAARQWSVTNDTILDDLAALPRDDWTSVAYEDLLADPAGTVARLLSFIDVPFDRASEQRVREPLPAARYTLSAPDAEKWRRNEAEILRVIPTTQATSRRIAAVEDERLAAPA